MSRHRWTMRALMLLAPLLGCAPFAHAAVTPSVALHYGHKPPVELLAQFDWAVVDADNFDSAQLPALQAQGTRAFAYVSIGEAEPAQLRGANLPESLIRTRNKAWGSAVMDLAAPQWSAYLIDQRIAQLWQAGYRGLFLDTLDSYQLFAHDDAERAKQQQALVAMIHRIHTQYPGVQLILNRGFEVLDQVHDEIVAVAAESLFKQYAAAKEDYGDVPAQEREELLALLKNVRERYQLPVIVIDYVAPSQRDQARDIARRIADLGFVPWISDGELDQMGVGSIEAMPREVLMLYQRNGEDDDIAYAAVHTYAAMPLEYLGYSAHYQDIAEPLPEGSLRGRYAGVVVWLNQPVPDARAYERWLRQQIADGVPVAFMGDLGFVPSGALRKSMGLTAVNDIDASSAKVIKRDALLGFEGFPETPPISEQGFRAARDDVHEHLLLADARKAEFAPVITAPWGGMALSPWAVEEVKQQSDTNTDDGSGAGDDYRQRWIIDPFQFFQQALHLPVIPVPDASTENGRRILTVHIDGDGFANRATLPGTPYVSQLILDRVLRKYSLPTTVSVIEGETGKDGQYPEQSAALEAIARQMFKLPNVEIASHTYSHPFDWLVMREGMASGENNMPIAGYRYSLQKEIDGSVAYINRELAPPGKQVKMLLWSGNALPTEDAIARVDALGLLNMNGGNTSMDQRDPTLASVSPMTRKVGERVQVYAPVINENVYTNGYENPLWGFDRAIQTFKLTDRPRRLKPITIYYHFFSGSHQSSLAALDKVYGYAQSQSTLPMYESEYARVVLDFARLGIARRLDGSWQISNATQARTLRIPTQLGYPDMARSSGVAGISDLPQGRYVALSGAPRASLLLGANEPARAYLLSSNGRIVEWDAQPQQLRFKLTANQPLQLSLGGVGAGCRIDAPGASSRRNGGHLDLHYARNESGDVRIDCH